MKHRLVASLAAVFVIGQLGLASVGHAQTELDQFSALADHIDSALAMLATGDVAAAQSDYQQFETDWPLAASSVQSRSPRGYQAITSAMADVTAALAADQVDPVSAQLALLKLRDASRDFITLSRPGSQTLTLYSSQHDYVTQALVDVFQAQTGITPRARGRRL